MPFLREALPEPPALWCLPADALRSLRSTFSLCYVTIRLLFGSPGSVSSVLGIHRAPSPLHEPPPPGSHPSCGHHSWGPQSSPSSLSGPQFPPRHSERRSRVISGVLPGPHLPHSLMPCPHFPLLVEFGTEISDGKSVLPGSRLGTWRIVGA